MSEKFKRIGKSAKTRSLKRLFASSNDQNIQTKLIQEENQVQEEFKARYNNTFILMGKNERLNYLEKSIPRRLAIVGIASVVALASLANRHQ